MTDEKPEKVFCLARADLAAVGLLDSATADPGLAEMLALPQYFIPRPEAEENPACKQIIPYQVFCRGKGIFVFRRGGGVGEKRLSGRLSIGIGGHVNDKDSEAGQMTENAFEAALLRERNEELVLSGLVETRFRGLINDDSDPVGRVHLGAVFLCRVEDDAHVALAGEEDLCFEGWWPAAEISSRRDQFEKWSILALDLVTPANFPA